MEYAARGNIGIVGTDFYELIEANTLEEAEDIARSLVVDWASSYGFDQDYDFFGDCDQVGYGWDDEEEDYDQVGELESWVENYEPPEHDMYLE